MGAWKIVIEGHGCHHNKRGDDANVLAADLVEQLKASGHDVHGASFALATKIGSDGKGEEYGEPESVLDFAAYLAANTKPAST